MLILADDLGYGDVQCYNPKRGKIPTPHLDKLAAQGMRFTDAHSSSGVCSPSRYTLLTGRYHWCTRMQSGIVGVFGEPLVAADRMTIATLAKQTGYQTACIGKWHLGWEWPLDARERKLVTGLGGKAGGGGADVVEKVTDEHRDAWKTIFAKPIAGGPTARGFDRYFGTDVPNWPPYCFIENDRTLGIPSELLPAEKLRKNQASIQGPALPGWSLEKILPALGDRACAFIMESAKERKPFLLYLPLTTPHTPLAVNDEWKGKSGLDNACADLILETDALVGRVLDAIEKAGAAENTLVIFTSDNGFAPYAGAKELEARGHHPSGPLRGYKADAWEGGHRVPFIVRWPGKVTPAGVSDQLVHHADLLATVAAVLGTKLPENAGEDSFSLLPLLQGVDKPVRQHAVSCSASGVPALRDGSWKLILAPGSGGWSPGVGGTPGAPGTPGDKQSVQLYDLASDIAEAKNLASAQPQRVEQMKAALEKIITEGRSTAGRPQKNDVKVKRYAQP